MRRILSLVPGALALLLVGCTSGGLTPECSPRSFASCECDDGTIKLRLCTPEGHLEACACGMDGSVAGASGQARDAGSTDGRDGAIDGRADSGRGFVKSLPVTANHLILDSKGNRLFATVSGAEATNPNSLVVIDVGTNQVTGSIPVGSEPSSLAISDDATTLWVGLDGASAIRKVDLTTRPPTPGKMFPLPQGEISGYMTVAGPMWVLQESTTTVAVSMQYPGLSPNLAGVVIFDDGVPRSEKAPSHTGAARLVRGEPGWLFGFNNLHTGFGFYALPVTASGVTQEEFGGLVAGFDADIVYASGRVYATSGSVVDVTEPTTPVRAGTFAFTGVIAPVPAKNRAYMLSPGTDLVTGRAAAQLRVLDTERFIQLSVTNVPGLTEERLFDLIRISDTQLVVIATDRFGDEGSRVVFVSVDPLP